MSRSGAETANTINDTGNPTRMFRASERSL
jgi:hypothetical protein